MLKNVLIVVDDIEKSIEFYRDLFGLQVILKNEGNVILSEGLVLQDAVDYKLISICHKGDIVVSQDYGVAAMALGKGLTRSSGPWF